MTSKHTVNTDSFTGVLPNLRRRPVSTRPLIATVAKKARKPGNTVNPEISLLKYFVFLKIKYRKIFSAYFKMIK